MRLFCVAPCLLILGATVFDGTGARPYRADVRIEAGRIAAIGTDLSPVEGVDTLQAEGRALIPGLVDLHTHWRDGGVPASTPRIAASYLSHGVTTVADFNAAPESYGARRAWLASLAAPHVLLCARMSTLGGHGADWADEATTRLAATPEAARAAVASVLPYQPDCLGEVFTDGWRYGTMPDNTDMNENALSALTDAAHAAGLRVLTHTVRVDKGREAAHAKVDVIDHALQDRELAPGEIDEIAAGSPVMAATLAVYEQGSAARKQNFARALRNIKRLYDGGVRIGTGTDAGVGRLPHGEALWREMELLAEAGIPPASVVRAATSGSIAGLGLSGDRGTIAPGKRADLLLIAGVPWTRIEDIRKLSHVILDGRLVVAPGWPEPNAGAPDLPPAVKPPPLIADFARPDGRTSLDTLITTDPEFGMDRTRQVLQIIPRGGHNVLLATAQLSKQPEARAEIVVPLTKGAVVPADLRAYRGLAFAARGDAQLEVTLVGPAGRWSAPVSLTKEEQDYRIAFVTLTKSATDWTGQQATEIRFRLKRPPGESLWTEFAALRFF